MYHSNIVFLVLVIIIHCQQYHHAHQEFVSQLFCIQHSKSIVLIPSDWDKTMFFPQRTWHIQYQQITRS